MKITGTKKFLIILLAMLCAVAAGLGAYWFATTLTDKSPTEAGLETDEAKLRKVAEVTTLDYRLVNFFSHAVGASASDMLEAAEEDKDSLADEIFQLSVGYKDGDFVLNEGYEEEDWYIAPDEMSEFAGTNFGLLSIWSNYYTSKSGGYNKDFYWDSTGFALGKYERWTTNKGIMSAGDGFYYSFAWLDEGEYFDFGLTSSISYSSVTLGATAAPAFFDSKLIGYHFTLSGGVYRGPDDQKRTIDQYKTEFSSNIAPSTSFMKRTDSTGNASGLKRVRVSADAPSGVYYMRFYGPNGITNQKNGRFLSSCFTSYSHENKSCGVWNTTFATDHMNNFSMYIDYVVILCRRSTSKLVMQYEPGVNTQLTEKTLEFTGDPITLTLENDWSAGLVTVTLQEQNASGGWVTATNFTQKTRSGIGTGTKSALVLQATNVGKYRVLARPYRQWGDGSNTQLEFHLTITQKFVEKPSLIEDTGVTGNKKYVNDTGQPQYISFHPLLAKYLNVDMGGLSQYSWTNDGLLMLSGSAQRKYIITVSLKNTTNMSWADGTYDNLTFEFEIGPKLIDAPEVVHNGGVTGNVKEVTYSGSDQTMLFMPVKDTEINVVASNGASYRIDDGTLTVSALNAGVYKVTLSPKTGFGWRDYPVANVTDPLEYTFIINTMKITAPELSFEGAKDNKIEVTFGGEYDENGNTWIQLVTFTNCREYQVDFIAPGMARYNWGDTQLQLQARNAGEYKMSFVCRENYEWGDGVVPPEVTLVIKKMPIELPYLVRDDGDNDAETKWTETTKELLFDFEEHRIVLWVGDGAALNISANNQLSEVRDSSTGRITYSATDSGTYNIDIAPTSNYCWKTDGSNDNKNFKFRIAPIEIDPLVYKYFDPAQNMWRDVWGKDADGWPTVTQASYDGTRHEVQIGDGTSNLQTGFNSTWHNFELVDANGSPLKDPASLTIQATRGEGCLKVSVINAGTYYIAINLNQKNYAWKGYNDSSRMLYSIQIRPQIIHDAIISEADCAAPNNTDFKVEGDTVHAVYWDQDVTLGISLDYAYRGFIAHEIDETEVSYGGWTDKGILTFMARNVATHDVTLKVTNSNYAWATRVGNDYEYYTERTFHITIIESPIAGLLFSFFEPNDSIEGGGEYKPLNNQGSAASGAMGGDTVTPYSTVFNEKPQTIKVERYPSAGMVIVETGFAAQYEYKITANALAEGFNEVVRGNLNSEYIGNGVGSTGLVFSGINAGTYTLEIWPSRNYCWNMGTEHRGDRTPVYFTFTINKRPVEQPKLCSSAPHDDAADERIDVSTSLKSIDYSIENNRHLTVQLLGFPNAYKTKSWEGLGVFEKEIAQTNTWTAYAKDTGEYDWEIELSSVNDYTWNIDYVTYTLKVTQLGIDLPTAYVVPDGTSYEDIDKLDGSKKAVLNLQNDYTNGVPFDGLAHLLYVYGNAITNGAVTLTYSFQTANGQKTADTFAMLTNAGGTNITFDMSNNTANNTALNAAVVRGGNLAYILSACKVNSYTVTVKFKDENYLWKKSPEADSGGFTDTSKALVYTYNITTKVVDVPTIACYEWQGIEDNSRFAYFEYEYDFDKKAVVSRAIDIPNVELGKLQANGKYSFINFEVSKDAGHADTSGTTTVALAKNEADEAIYNAETGYGTLHMDTVAGATVPTVYCVALSLDKDNERWNTGGTATDIDNKYFYIVITKRVVNLPVVSASSGRPSSIESDQWRYVTYSGDVWNDAFEMTGVDTRYMTYEAQVAGMTINHIDDVNDANYGRLTLSTPAPVNDYEVKVSLKDKDNLQWIGSTTDDVFYGLIVEPIKIAKVGIHVETNDGDEGVYGDTKKVKYDDGNNIVISVKNFWFDSANRWLTYSVISADSFNSNVADYMPGYFTQPDATNKSAEGYKPEFDQYNTGLLSFEAMYAGTYVIEFALTQNALWFDGSDENIRITLQIDKKEYDTPIIFVDDSDTEKTITSRTKTYSYKIDENGDAVARVIEIVNYNDAIMSMSKTTPVAADPGTATDNYILNGFDEVTKLYGLQAKLAGTYTVEFKIKDFKNTRWKFADSESILFTLQIDKQSLTTPYASREYLMRNEEIEPENNGTTKLKVVYDTREHGVLVENVMGADYMTYTPNADVRLGGGLYCHVQKYAIADIGTTSVKDVYGSTYVGEKDTYLISGAIKSDFVLFQAVSNPDAEKKTGAIPGTYSIVFTLTDKVNMQWADGTTQDKTFVIEVSKMQHAAPKISEGDSNSKQYNGGDVEFSLSNVFNGKKTPDGEVESYVYEQYMVESFDDGKNKITYTDYDPSFEKSWYDGELTLKMNKVGTYVVKVWINPEVEAYTEWAGTSAKEIRFTFVITKRTLKAEFIFGSSDEATNAAFQLGSSQWCLSTPVSVTLKITNVVKDQLADMLDKNFAAKIYFLAGTSATQNMIENILPATWLVDENDGVYTLTYVYMLPYGADNITIGSYSVGAEQINGDTSNYTLKTASRKYTVIADPAPFKESLLVWRYSYTTDKDKGIYAADAGLGANANQAFTIPFLTDGGTYKFELWMNSEGMSGPEGKDFFTDINTALNAWWVKIDSITGLTAKNAGAYTAYVTLSALDSSRYSYTTKTIPFYYTITQAKYNLTDMHWNYSGNPFTFNGSGKSVAVVGNTYPKLSISYPVTGSYVSNSQVYAGTYNTRAQFSTTDPNYVTPVLNDTKTYDGTFDWTCRWQISKQEIEVWWKEGNTSSDGTTVTKSPVLAVHSSKVTYNYWKYNETSKTWEQVTSLKREPGKVVKFRVQAVLKASSPIQPSNYANNYILKFKEGEVNPMELELGGDDEVIYTHIEVNGTTDKKFEYTGSRFTAEVIIDLDTSGGVITNKNLVLNYYVKGSSTPLSAAPYQIGNYVVRVRAVWNNSSVVYYLSEDEYEFSIVKANFKPEAFEWRYSHTTPAGVTITAKYDAEQGKWLDKNGDAVTFTYDGRAHRVYLASTYSTSTINMSMLNGSFTDAGTYTSTANFIYNTNLWNAPKVANTFTWKIEKALLDLSLAEWDYTNDYVYTLIGGKAKEYSVKIKNIPDYLYDMVTYTTVADGDFVENKQSQVGKYVTTVFIDESKINKDNYILGEFAESFEKSFTWNITHKKLSVPASDGSWTQFDGRTHNLLYALDLPVDWEEYFTINISYTSADNATSAYDGSTMYGLKYIAYNAGTYTLTFSIKDGINPENAANVVWAVAGVSGGAETLTVDDKTALLVVAKQTLTATGWTENYEASTINVDGDVVVSRFIEYEFHEGESPDGKVVTLDQVLEARGGDKFTIVPHLRDEYSGNINLTFASEGNYGTYLIFAALDLKDRNGFRVGGDDGKPWIYGYVVDNVTKYFTKEEIDTGHLTVLYTGKPIEFLIYNWDAYYSHYLNFYGGDELTQTNAGRYTATYIFKNDPTYVYYWNQREDGSYDRSSVTFSFEIKYLMVNLPEKFPTNVTYSGSAINIIERAFGSAATFNEWVQNYANYLEITGNTATEIGEYKLYMRVKEEFADSVRWDNGTAVGDAGTFSAIWNIDPIYLVKPVLNQSASIVYDGNEHSVYEVLVGYSADGLSSDLLGLIQNVRLSVEGSRSVKAGEFTATFSLPNENYAWKDSASTDSVPITWSIAKQVINLNDVHWIQVAGDGEGESWAFDEEKPFVFTIENGNVKAFKVELGGLPELLLPFVTYSTDGIATNSMSAVGTYKTSFVLSYEGKIDTDNYEIGSLPQDISRELTWKIIERGFDNPANSGDWTAFDGDVHDLMQLLGYEEGWDNYFNVTVKYAADGEELKLLDPFNDGTEETEYSIYKGFRNGKYELTVALKPDEPVKDNVYWKDPEGSKTALIEVSKMTVTVTGWNEADDLSTAKFKETLTDAQKALLEYVVYESDTKKLIESSEQIQPGISYTVELRAKSAYAFGIELLGETTYTFGWFDYGEQPTVWVPIPVLKETVKDFTGDPVPFEIVGWDNNDAATRLYYLSFDAKETLNWLYKTKLTDNDVRYAYVYGGDEKLSPTKAGSYEVIIRLNSQIRLSWFDSTKYNLVGGKLYDKSTGKEVTNLEEDRTSKILKFEVTKKAVTPPDFEEIFGDVKLELEYKEEGGQKVSQNITESDKYKALFKKLYDQYGSLIEITDVVQADSGEYTLHIRLTDTESSYWAIGGYDDVVVKEENYKVTYVLSDGTYKAMYVIKNADGTYKEYNGGDYALDLKYKTDYDVDFIDITGKESEYLAADGKPIKRYVYDDGGEIVTNSNNEAVYVEYVVNADETAVRYSFNPETGRYVIDPNGNFISCYKLNAEGEKLFALDVENCVVTVKVEKTSKDPYPYKWSIVTSALDAPTVKDGTKLVYTSKEQSILEYLTGFDANKMRIEGETATDAGEYTAKVYLKDGNFKWESADGETLEYVTVTWKIEKTALDFTDAKWNYTAPYTYTVSEGKAQAFKVELVLPEALKDYAGLIVYTTNGTEGANAGRNAGKYVTTFKVDYNVKNIERVIIPDELSSLMWYINKRAFDLPQFSVNKVVFTDQVYDLISMLNLAEGWENYLDVTVSTVNGETELPYLGYDKDGSGIIEGAEKYYVHGVGTYKLNLAIKEGINTNALRPNVVWLKPLPPVVTPDPDEGEEGGEEGGETGGETGGEVVAPVEPSAFMFMILPVEGNYNAADDEDLFVAPDFSTFAKYDHIKYPDTATESTGTDGKKIFKWTDDQGREHTATEWTDDEGDHIVEVIVEEGGLSTTTNTEFTNKNGVTTFETETTVIQPSVDPDNPNPDNPNPDNPNPDNPNPDNPNPDNPNPDNPNPDNPNPDNPNPDNPNPDNPNPDNPNPDPGKDDDIDDSQIVDPGDDDRTDQIGWTLMQQVITMGVDQLVVPVKGWTGINLAAKIEIDWALSGYTQEIVDIVSKINFLDDYLITDAKGNPVGIDEITDPANAGHTYFIIPQIKNIYSGFIVLKFVDEKDGKYSFSTDFPPTQELVKLPDFPESQLKFSENFTGSDITFKIEFLETWKNVLYIAEGSLTHKNAGKYYVTVCFQDGVAYSWADGSRSAVVVELEINPQLLDAIDALEDTSYTGKPIDIQELLNKAFGGDFVKVVPGYNTEETEVGNYEIHVTLNGNYGENVAWENGSTGEKVLTWKIIQAEVIGDWNIFGTLDLKCETFEGDYDEYVTYTYTNVATGQVITDGKLEVGVQYSVQATFTNPSLNFTGFENPHTFTLDVEPIRLIKPVISDSKKSYTGQSWTFVIDNWDEVKDYVEITGDELTQTEVGNYSVTITIKDQYATWNTLNRQPLTLNFSIDKAVISGSWNSRGKLVFTTGSYIGSYDGLITYTYTDADGNPVTANDFRDGGTYIATAVLTDPDNFKLDDSIQNPMTFTFSGALTLLRPPVLVVDNRDYTGNAITFVISNMAELSEYVEVTAGSLRQTKASPDGTTYEVTLSVKQGVDAEWEGGATSYTVKFTINKAEITGAWNNDGTAALVSGSYKGTFEGVINYNYYDAATLSPVDANSLVEGESYIAEVVILDENFKFADDFTARHQFIYKQKAQFKLNWWQILLLVLGILILILIILIIIIAIRRKKEGAYDYPEDEEGYPEDGNYGEGDFGADDYGTSGVSDDYGDVGGDFGSDDGIGASDDYGGGADDDSSEFGSSSESTGTSEF